MSAALQEFQIHKHLHKATFFHLSWANNEHTDTKRTTEINRWIYVSLLKSNGAGRAKVAVYLRSKYGKLYLSGTLSTKEPTTSYTGIEASPLPPAGLLAVKKALPIKWHLHTHSAQALVGICDELSLGGNNHPIGPDKIKNKDGVDVELDQI